MLGSLSWTIRGQEADSATIQDIIAEANDNSQLEVLAHQLLDVIGPRLVGTPEMEKAHDWAVDKFESWGIDASNEEWGQWKGWQRGITHVDMIFPRIQTLRATQLAWSPTTTKKGIEAELLILADVEDSSSFAEWLPNVKGKLVMVSLNQPTGRPDENWQEFATEESFKKMKEDRDSISKAWRERTSKTGYTRTTLPVALEDAGAAGIISSRWSKGFGANKIFEAYTKRIPNIDISMEDYGMLFRLVEHGHSPKVRIVAESRELGPVPTFNTIAQIEGVEKPEEYVILSAHFDSWDGATGATDNGTGTIIMMEAARILKKIYPNPKRTILVGLWGSEEQGLNGSRAFVEDNPDIVEGVQALFNQDNGTGRVVNLSGQGFLHSYEYLGRWLDAVPRDITRHIETSFPGSPRGGGSDYAPFIAAGAPAFSLYSLSWDYWNYTWHTNIDTYDKIVFDDVRSNVILTAILAYMASEDPEKTSREKSVLPLSHRTGERMKWPAPRKSDRKGRLE